MNVVLWVHTQLARKWCDLGLGYKMMIWMGINRSIYFTYIQLDNSDYSFQCNKYLKLVKTEESTNNFGHFGNQVGHYSITAYKNNGVFFIPCIDIGLAKKTKHFYDFHGSL